MQNTFKNWLVMQGVKEFSANGNRSTAYDYSRRVRLVCKAENLTWKELTLKIDEILPLYLAKGEKYQDGLISHESVKNALKHFRRFVNQYKLAGVEI